MRRLLALAPFFVAGVIVAAVVASPKPGFCESRPTHPKCRAATTQPPTVTSSPPTATVPGSTEPLAHIWVSAP
jgi:hypothetical protein